MNTILFLLCWISYFSTYIGRQNYSAVMAEMKALSAEIKKAELVSSSVTEPVN